MIAIGAYLLARRWWFGKKFKGLAAGSGSSLGHRDDLHATAVRTKGGQSRNGFAMARESHQARARRRERRTRGIRIIRSLDSLLLPPPPEPPKLRP